MPVRISRLAIVTRVVERYLIVWLVLLSVIAYWSAAALPPERNPFVVSKDWLWYLIALTMFAIGSMLPRDEIRQVARRWPTVFTGTAIQYTTMPLLAFTCGRLFGLGEAAMIGIMLVGCVPGAMASNVLTLIARGNVSYSVSLTTSATLFSPLIVPLVLQLALGQMEIDIQPGQRAVELSLYVVIPVVLGHLVGRRLSVAEALVRQIGSLVANLVILWVIAVVVAVNHDRLSGTDATILFALLLVNLGGYTAGYLGGAALKLSQPMRKALTLEIGMQNAGLGTTIALASDTFPPEAAIPTALYTFGCMFTGTILARYWGAMSARAEDSQETTSE